MESVMKGSVTVKFLEIGPDFKLNEHYIPTVMKGSVTVKFLEIGPDFKLNEHYIPTPHGNLS